MAKVSQKDIEQLISNLIVPMFLIERTIPIPTDKVRRMENDAEHSWSVAMLACSLASAIDPSLDVGKISQYATVHDLVEVYAGDTSVWHDKEFLETKEEREKQALEKIRSESKAFPWIGNTLADYEQQADNESKFVKAVDKLIALYYDHLDGGQYYVDNKITVGMFDETMSSHRRKAHIHPTVAIYYEEIRKVIVKNPKYFYQK